MKIVFLDQSHLKRANEQFNFTSLQALGDFSLHEARDREEILRVSRDAEVVITGKCRLDRDLLAQMQRTHLIVKAGTSCDRIDIAAAQELGITVCNLPGHGELVVAQNTFALLLALAGSIVRYDEAVKCNSWRESQYAFPSIGLAGKTLGIIGFGAIGRRVASLAKAFDMRVLVHTRYPLASSDIGYTGLAEIAAESDVVSLHCLLNAQTANLIDWKFLSAMRNSAFLVNTARAGLVDEHALCQALQSDTIAGAAFDVFWQEPPPENHPLLSQKNFLVTPHVAWAAVETRQQMLESIALAISNFQQGNVQNAVTGN